MEYILVASILGMGFMFQNNKNNKKKLSDKFMRKKIPSSQIPSSRNVYTSKRAYNIHQWEQDKANKLFNKSLYPQDTNVITPGPPAAYIYNKVDYNETKLPVEFNIKNKPIDVEITPSKNDDNNINSPLDSKENPDSGGFEGISLTGEPINPKNFTHNNMQPFFGGGVKQNLDEYSTRGIFENFTGTSDNYQKKQEQKPLFQPQKNMSNVYGSQNLDGYMLDRYYVSNIRSNETPIEKVYVGPGLNKGYTNEPTGGFQQSDTRDYVLPKTTDQTRVKTNPKISYYGRVNSGEKINKPSKIGTVYKNQPDTFYVQDPDRYFTTTGQIIAPEQRPCIVTKYTNRKTTELQNRKGSAAPTRGTIAQVRSKYKVSNKVTYRYDDPANPTKEGQWSITNLFTNKTPNDYGKKSIRLRNNKKIPSNNKHFVMNYKSDNKKVQSRSTQKIKKPKKYYTIKNKRNGNFQGSTKNIVYDPNDVARTTIKETNIDNNFRSNVGVDTRGNVVYNPNSIARTTIKETNIDNNFRSNVGVDTRGNTVYNPNSIARTTIKETNIDNNFRSNVGVDTRGNVVYDPNDVARTTIKETNIDNNFRSNVGVDTRGNVVYDPNDIARTTIKETNIDNNRRGVVSSGKKKNYTRNKNKAKKTIKQGTMIEDSLGIATKTRNDGHSIKEVQVPGTQRMSTSVNYMGTSDGPDLGAYEVTEVDAKETKKEKTSDIEYVGTAGNDGVNTAPMSYQDIYNSTIKAIRGDIDEGYTPGANAPNKIVSSENINATSNKLNEKQNEYLNERGVQATKVYNSIPQINEVNITNNKDIVPNEPLADRLNPDMIKAFKENPYTQSLKSWA